MQINNENKNTTMYVERKPRYSSRAKYEKVVNDCERSVNEAGNKTLFKTKGSFVFGFLP